MSYGAHCRPSSDLALLWLWGRPSAAAPVQPLAWELPYATGAALEAKKKSPVENLLLYLYQIFLYLSFATFVRLHLNKNKLDSR